MEALVVTLETAQRLKAAGFPHHSAVNYWHEQGQADGWLNQSSNSAGLSTNHIEDIAAPTAQEIADQLPRWLDEPDGIWPLQICAKGLTEKTWYAGFERFGSSKEMVEADTMAEALALLWLKLQETIPNGTSPVQDKGTMS